MIGCDTQPLADIPPMVLAGGAVGRRHCGACPARRGGPSRSAAVVTDDTCGWTDALRPGGDCGASDEDGASAAPSSGS